MYHESVVSLNRPTEKMEGKRKEPIDGVVVVVGTVPSAEVALVFLFLQIVLIVEGRSGGKPVVYKPINFIKRIIIMDIY